MQSPRIFVLKSVDFSFAPTGLAHISPAYPRLTAWAVFVRRFAAWDASGDRPALRSYLVHHAGSRSFPCGRAGQFSPRDQLNFLLSQNLAELITGEKIVVALPPSRAPCGAFPRGGAQFFVVVTGMDDELRHSGFQVLECGQVELCPFFWRDFRFNRNRVVQHDIVG